MVTNSPTFVFRTARMFGRQAGAASIIFGGGLTGIIVLVGLLAPILAPHDPEAMSLSDTLLPPAFVDGGISAYLLGTDALGRDVLSRLIYGAQVSLLVGVATVLGSGVIGVALGLISGYLGGLPDSLIQKTLEAFQSLPFLLIAIIVMAVFGQGLQNLILVLVLTRWIPFCRVVRGDVLTLRNREYVLAARASGVREPMIVLRHILPNVLPSVTVIATFSLSIAIIAEAGLSFLGLGVPPNIPTWGTMLSEGRDYMYADPWLTVLPSAALFVTVIAVNILGDGIRDYADPKL